MELSENGYYEEYCDGIEVRDFLTDEVLRLTNYTLLGKPDEIKEEDAEELVEPFDFSYYVDYNHPSRGAYTITATESLLSALENVIFWNVNPVKLFDMDNLLKAKHIAYDEIKKFNEAELCTFDKKRSLIFVKN